MPGASDMKRGDLVTLKRRDTTEGFVMGKVIDADGDQVRVRSVVCGAKVVIDRDNVRKTSTYAMARRERFGKPHTRRLAGQAPIVS